MNTKPLVDSSGRVFDQTDCVIITTIEDSTVGFAALKEFSPAACIEWVEDEGNFKRPWSCDLVSSAGGLTTVIVRSPFEVIFFIGKTADYRE